MSQYDEACLMSTTLYVFIGEIRKMSKRMTKPTKWLCAKQRLRSAWASTQSDQGLYWVLIG